MSPPNSAAITSEAAEATPRIASMRLVGLAAAYVLVPVVLAFTSPLSIITFVMYQTILVTMWSVLGTWPLGPRILALAAFPFYVVAMLAVVALVLDGGFHDPDFSAADQIIGVLALAACITIVCVITFLLVRCWFELQRIVLPDTIDRSYVSRIRIRHLLGITLICAVVVAITSTMKQGFRPPLLIAFAIVLAPWLSGAIALVWAILTPRFAWTRLATTFVINILAAALAIVQFEYDLSSILSMVPAVIIYGVSLWILRGDGYRFVRRKGMLLWRGTRQQTAGADGRPPAGSLGR